MHGIDAAARIQERTKRGGLGIRPRTAILRGPDNRVPDRTTLVVRKQEKELACPRVCLRSHADLFRGIEEWVGGGEGDRRVGRVGGGGGVEGRTTHNLHAVVIIRPLIGGRGRRWVSKRVSNRNAFFSIRDCFQFPTI